MTITRITHHWHGVSLIELTVGLAVFIILLTLVVPSFQQYFKRQKIGGVGDNLHFLFRFARAESAKNNQKLWLKFYVNPSNSKQWQVALTNNNHCEFTDANPCLLSGIRRGFKAAQYQDVEMVTNISSLSIDPSRGRGNAGSVSFVIDNIDVKLTRNSFGRHIICTNTPAKVWRYRSC